MESLQDIAKKHGTDKVEHGYISVYDELFSPFRNREVKILELGVGDVGASVKAWREYFINGDVFMFDPFFIKSQTVTEEELQNLNITTIRGNQLSREDLERAATHGPFDIIIDDASHSNDGVMLSLAVLLKSLSPGGVYIVEDLLCIMDRGARLGDVNAWLDGDDVDGSITDIIYHQPEHNIKTECINHLRETGKWISMLLTEEEKQYIEQNLIYIDVEAHHNMLLFYKRGNTTFDSPETVKNLSL
jgi:hypothetical protein